MYEELILSMFIRKLFGLAKESDIWNFNGLTNLWNTPHSNRYQTIQNKAKTHRLIFDDKAVLELTKDSFPLQTEKSNYQSKSKQIKLLCNKVNELEADSKKRAKQKPPQVADIQFWAYPKNEKLEAKYPPAVKNIRRSASF